MEAIENISTLMINKSTCVKEDRPICYVCMSVCLPVCVLSDDYTHSISTTEIFICVRVATLLLRCVCVCLYDDLTVKVFTYYSAYTTPPPLTPMPPLPPGTTMNNQQSIFIFDYMQLP